MFTIDLQNSDRKVTIDEVDGDLRHDKWFIDEDGYVLRTRDRKPLAHCIIENMMLALKDKVDHVDRDTLNNCRNNIRPATNSESNANRDKPVTKKEPTSKHKGVRWVDSHQKWKVEIQVKGRKKHIGYYADETEAAKKYNQAAKMYHGDFAVLNNVPEA